MDKTIIMDTLDIMSGDIPWMRDESSEFFGEYNKASNQATKMYFDLYKNKRLTDICEYITEHRVPTNGDIIIDFVIDRDKLSDDFIEEMESKYPGTGLKECCGWSKCSYTRCTGLSARPFNSFRDWYGTVGRSFEHPLLAGFYPKDAEDFYEISSSSPVDAAIECIKRMWGESETKSQTKEEYDEIIEGLYPSNNEDDDTIYRINISSEDSEKAADLLGEEGHWYDYDGCDRMMIHKEGLALLSENDIDYDEI